MNLIKSNLKRILLLKIDLAYKRDNMQQKPKKLGRPKSAIKRKPAMFSLSEYQTRQFAKAEGKLKAEGLQIKRSRSETAELAIALLLNLLDSEHDKSYTLELIKQHINYEENGYQLND